MLIGVDMYLLRGATKTLPIDRRFVLNAARLTDKRVGTAPLEAGKAEALVMRAMLLQLLGRTNEAHAAMRLAHVAFAKGQQAATADLFEGWLAYNNGAWAESRRAFRRVFPIGIGRDRRKADASGRAPALGRR